MIKIYFVKLEIKNIFNIWLLGSMGEKLQSTIGQSKNTNNFPSGTEPLSARVENPKNTGQKNVIKNYVS